MVRKVKMDILGGNNHVHEGGHAQGGGGQRLATLDDFSLDMDDFSLAIDPVLLTCDDQQSAPMIPIGKQNCRKDLLAHLNAHFAMDGRKFKMIPI